MDGRTYKIPTSATIDRETEQITMHYREGTRGEFIAAMRPLFAACQILMQPPQRFAPGTETRGQKGENTKP